MLRVEEALLQGDQQLLGTDGADEAVDGQRHAILNAGDRVGGGDVFAHLAFPLGEEGKA